MWLSSSYRYAMGFGHADGHHDAGNEGESSDGGDGPDHAETIGHDPRQERPEGVTGVPPEPVDPHGGGSPGGGGDVPDGGQQGRGHQGGAGGEGERVPP